MARKTIEDLVPDKADMAAVTMIRECAVQFGRAVSLSCIAATCGELTEDHAIARADAAWTELADKVILFAMEED